jgi:succinate dehydrogenase/fumarate reductase cytochrome b subunit
MHPDQSWATGRVTGVLVAVATALTLRDLTYVTSVTDDESGVNGVTTIVITGFGLAVAALLFIFVLPHLKTSVQNSGNCITDPSNCQAPG